ncbi:MAG: hypothetical protein IPF99_15475 [Deltaproteobacteria bacterium]|nr:hypothetical protein [Deltaproteobacteria bacterium]
MRPKVPKGAVGAVAPPGDDTHDDPLEVMKARNGKYSLQNANPMPQTNLELSYHIFNPMTVGPGKPSPVLNAFIAIARDRRTRDAVSEANRTKISERAVLTPGKAGHTALPIYTEAAYAFVSMCKHNWGLTNSQLSLDHLSSYLSKAGGDLVREWTTPRGFAGRRRRRWTESDVAPPTIEFRMAAAKATRNRRHAMVYNDARSSPRPWCAR